MAESTYYDNIKNKRNLDKSSNNPNGRPIPSYSYHLSGHKVSDVQIKEYLMELVNGDGFPYGYRKLAKCLKDEYLLKINKKKVYRFCKELDILRRQRKLKKHHTRKLAKRTKVTNSNQLWEMDFKYGYIKGADQFFFQLSLIDVFDRNIISYHLGLSCKAEDAARVLKNALAQRKLTKGMDNLPTIRTDNGPQFVSMLFGNTCKSLGLTHQRIPVKTPNMNEHIESFHSILERDCYSMNEFNSYIQVCEIISENMDYYNNSYRHESLNDISTSNFYQAIQNKEFEPKEFIA